MWFRHYTEISPVAEQRGVKLSAPFHLMPSLTTCGAILQPPRTFMPWCSIKHKDKQGGEECPRNESSNPNSQALVLVSSLQILLNPSSLWHSKNSLFIKRLIHSWKLNSLAAKTEHLRWIKFREYVKLFKITAFISASFILTISSPAVTLRSSRVYIQIF